MAKRKFILGVDPGFTGGVAITDGEGLNVIDMPIHQIMERPEIDAKSLSHHVDMFAKSIKYAVVEDVHSMPGDGNVSMFRFGFGAGVVQGVLC